MFQQLAAITGQPESHAQGWGGSPQPTLMAGKSLHRIGAQLLRPAPEHVLMDLQIPRRLGHADPALLDQSDRFNLELSRKHSPSHGPPPASSNTFSRCPRNPQQASVAPTAVKTSCLLASRVSS